MDRVGTQAKNGGKKCENTKSTTSCNTQPCPVDCSVASWGGWGGCSKACGTGSQNRSRKVTRKTNYGGKKCPALKQSRACNTKPCPVNCAVSSWGGFGACSKTCGPGSKTRRRTIRVNPAHGGAACPALSNSAACNKKSCPINCAVRGWGGWSGCSKTCGSGKRSRSRSVSRNAAYGGSVCPFLKETQSCNTKTCPSHRPST